MPKITLKDVDYVAKLARLDLTVQEKEQYTVQLGSILSYIDKLNELDTKNVKPTQNVVDIENAWREDKTTPCSEKDKEKLLNNAPETEDNYYKVKKVIE